MGSTPPEEETDPEDAKRLSTLHAGRNPHTQARRMLLERNLRRGAWAPRVRLTQPFWAVQVF
jgi:hypothetical protein